MAQSKLFVIIGIALLLMVGGVLFYVKGIPEKTAGAIKTIEDNRTSALSQLQEMGSTVKIFIMDNGKSPEKLDDLVVNPGSAPNWKGPYLKELSNDPWGRPFIYQHGGSDFTLVTYGRDGVPGGTGDDADLNYVK